MKIETKCKFCLREIEMEVDQSGFENPSLNTRLWLKNVACQRCADFYRVKNDTSEQIGKICHLLLVKRDDKNFVEAAREKLKQKTQNLCRLICDFKFAQFTWDIEFVNMLMERPDAAYKIINLFSKRLDKAIIESAE